MKISEMSSGLSNFAQLRLIYLRLAMFKMSYTRVFMHWIDEKMNAYCLQPAGVENPGTVYKLQ